MQVRQTVLFRAMGKKKNKMFGAPKPQPTGLPPVNGSESELMNSGPPTVVTDVLDQVW